MPSLLQKAAAAKPGRVQNGFIYTCDLDELIELVNAWAVGTVTSEAVVAVLEPDNKAKYKPARGEHLVLLALRRIIASKGSVVGPLDSEAKPPDRAPPAMPQGRQPPSLPRR